MKLKEIKDFLEVEELSTLEQLAVQGGGKKEKQKDKKDQKKGDKDTDTLTGNDVDV